MATRAYIRRRVGTMTRQAKVVTATSVGTTTSLVDAINLAYPTGKLIGRVGWVCVGDPSNQERSFRVTANSSANTDITFTPALPVATQIGDEVELWNEFDQGIVPTLVHEFINTAIEYVRYAYPITAVDDEQDFSRSSPVLSIPDTWKYFSGVEAQSPTGLWRPLTQKQFRVRKFERSVELVNGAQDIANNYPVRLIGATIPSDLDADDDSTIVDTEWLIKQVSALVFLHIAYSNGDGQAIERYTGSMEQAAADVRMKARGRMEGAGTLLPDAA
jgi:hypothetical protein